MNQPIDGDEAMNKNSVSAGKEHRAVPSSESLKTSELDAAPRTQIQCADCWQWINRGDLHTCSKQISRNQRRAARERFLAEIGSKLIAKDKDSSDEDKNSSVPRSESEIIPALNADLSSEEAQRDLNAYGRMLQENQVSGMIAIEKRHGLYGYPPSIVMQGLAAKAQGKDMDAELDRLLG